MSTPEQESNVRKAYFGGQGAKVYYTRRQRIAEWVLAALVVAVLVGAAFLVSVRATANGTEASLSKLCPLARDIGNSTIPPAAPGTDLTVVPTGISDIGYMRIFYQTSCSIGKYGQLIPVTDPRLQFFLRSKGR